MPARPAGLKKRLAFIAAAAGGERGGTLVYANGAAESEDVAGLISQLLPVPRERDKELAALADLARDGVHQKYLLAPLVERGCGFSLRQHALSSSTRGGATFPCRQDSLSCLHLDAHRGSQSFLPHNCIAGAPERARPPYGSTRLLEPCRSAGRWGNEFQGNIICIDPENHDAWPGGVPTRKRYSIKRESDAVMELGDSLVNYLDRRSENNFPGKRRCRTFGAGWRLPS